MKLVIEAILENLGTRNDGTVKLSIGTQEIDPSQVGNLFQLRGKYIKLLLSDTNITELEASLVDSESLQSTKKFKSPSQRLRGVLFKFHESINSQMDFETFYKIEVEKIIDAYKSKLNED